MKTQHQGGFMGWMPTSKAKARKSKKFEFARGLEQLDQRTLLSTAAFSVTQDWGTGFGGQVVVENSQSTPITNWSLAFNFDRSFTSIWDGTIASHSGNSYVIQGAGWDNTIAAGGSVEFGFNGSPGNVGNDAPTGYVLNGVALGGQVGPVLPSLSINNVTVNDGTAGASATFTVTMTKVSTAAVSVQYATADGTAKAGTDYTATSGTLSIPAGSSTGTITVPVLSDATAKPNLAFSVVLSNPNSSDIGTGTGTGTIVDTVKTVAPPVANPDSATTTENTPATISVLANDTDAAGRTLSVASATQGKDGSTVVNANGTITYTPSTGYTGSDRFTYTVSDGQGLTASTTVSIAVNPPATTKAWPTEVYAPYVDMTLYPTYNLASAVQTAGIKYFSLAFIVADSNNAPSWGGYSSYEVNGGSFDLSIRSQIQQVRALGGDVDVSFGGAAGTELAQAITSVPTLTAAYQQVITAYGLSHIDFDIEGAAVADNASIDRRSQAIAALEKTAAAAGTPLTVSFTLPVLPTGLTANGLYVLQSASKYGAKISLVNGMAMDYGDSAAPNPAGQMGTYAIDVAQSLYGQLSTLYGTSETSAQLWSMIGITPMIGVNDASDEVFELTDATQLVAFAKKEGLGRLGIWSLGRDQEDPAGALAYAESTSSSIVQSPFAFSDIFETFTN